MDLLEIRSWLDQIIKQEISGDEVKSDPILEKINQASYSFLEEENQIFEHEYDDFFDLFNHYQMAGSYKGKTIKGYFYSWSHSSEIINSNNSDYINQRLIEWWDNLQDEVGGTEKNFRYALNIYFHLEGGDVPLDLYEWSRKMFYIEMAEFIDQHYEVERLSKGQQPIKGIESEIVNTYLNNLEWLENKIGLKNVYPKVKGWWWPDFWRVKFMIENIEKELRRGGGPAPKIINNLKGVDDTIIFTILGWDGLSEKKKNNLRKYAEFCRDLNIHIENNECVYEDQINTWELAGMIMEKKKYNFLDDRDGLNKFIKSCFETRWLKFESEYNLIPILKFDSNYYIYFTE